MRIAPASVAQLLLATILDAAGISIPPAQTLPQIQPGSVSDRKVVIFVRDAHAWFELPTIPTTISIAARILQEQIHSNVLIVLESSKLRPTHKIIAALADNVIEFEESSVQLKQTTKLSQVKWDDIGGHFQVKKLLEESVVGFYKNKQAYKRLGIEPSHGILLYGPPGTGKTLLARAVAHESGAHFLPLSLTDLVKGHVGESEKALSNAFGEARRLAPCILFLDEIDSLFQSRDSGGDVALKLHAQIAVEMDSIVSESTDVVFLAATNHIHALDNALFRSGRFDRLIYVGPPSDAADRESILKVLLQKHMNNKKEDLCGCLHDLNAIAHDLAHRHDVVGMTGADLNELVRQTILTLKS